jgi:hypothetical protein
MRQATTEIAVEHQQPAMTAARFDELMLQVWGRSAGRDELLSREELVQAHSSKFLNQEQHAAAQIMLENFSTLSGKESPNTISKSDTSQFDDLINGRLSHIKNGRETATAAAAAGTGWGIFGAAIGIGIGTLAPETIPFFGAAGFVDGFVCGGLFKASKVARYETFKANKHGSVTEALKELKLHHQDHYPW